MSRYRIRVPMHELPRAVFRTKDTRHPQGNRSDLLAPADLRLKPLDLEDVREVRGYAFREGLELDGSAVAVVRCGSPSGLLNLTAAAGWRAKGIREGGIIALAVQLEERAGIPPRDLIQRPMARFNRSVEVLRCGHAHTSSRWPRTYGVRSTRVKSATRTQEQTIAMAVYQRGGTPRHNAARPAPASAG